MKRKKRHGDMLAEALFKGDGHSKVIADLSLHLMVFSDMDFFQAVSNVYRCFYDEICSRRSLDWDGLQALRTRCVDRFKGRFGGYDEYVDNLTKDSAFNARTMTLVGRFDRIEGNRDCYEWFLCAVHEAAKVLETTQKEVFLSDMEMTDRLFMDFVLAYSSSGMAEDCILKTSKAFAEGLQDRFGKG